MASPLVSRAPQCMSCIRRMAGSLGDASKPGSQSYQQIRGKKKLAKTTAKVHVRLIKNMPSYGRKGTVLSLAPGLMRNSFYPRKVAEYITPAELREIGVDKVVERDRTYGLNGLQETSKDRHEREEKDMRLMQREASLKQAEIVVKEEEEVEPALPDLLSPQRSTKILENLLPSYLEFYRSPVVVAPPVKKRLSPSIPATSTLSAAASEGKEAEKATGKTSIYGSVSTADIAANLKALLAEDKEGSRVVLSSEDIVFVEAEGEEKDRVKHLGIFEVDIALKGATDVIRRSIKVTAQA